MNIASLFHQKVSAFIAQDSLFESTDKLLVALSGGADSLALLRVLLHLGYKCAAAHCNFHLRGDESNRDEAFCHTLCKELDVELHVIHFDTVGYACEQGISIEMAAREMRYKWFEELCKEYSYTHVAVAHHRDDSVETLLLNLIRGTGIAGLTGIRPVNGRVVRPLLGVSRAEIVDYLKVIGQGYVTDSTNLQDEYVRNKIRLHLLPMMQELNPSIKEGLSATATRLRSVEAVYAKAMDDALARVRDAEGGRVISIPALMAELEPRAVLFEALRPFGFVAEQVDDIFRALRGESGRCFANKEWQVLKDRDTLLIRPNQEEHISEVKVHQLPVKVTLTGGLCMHVNRMLLTPEYRIPRTLDVATLDAAQVTLPLIVRQWREGDKFAPFGMKGRKKLVSDLLTDLKLSLFEKRSQLVVTDAHDRILWVVGRRTDERTRVNDRTKEIIEIKIIKTEL